MKVINMTGQQYVLNPLPKSVIEPTPPMRNLIVNTFENNLAALKIISDSSTQQTKARCCPLGVTIHIC